MTNLVACLSTGKGTWNQIIRLIKSKEWDHVFLITNEFGKEKFQTNEKISLIVIDTNKYERDLVKDIISALQGKIKDTEVALNLSSGTGKEHMVVLSALLKLGLGIRFVIAAGDNILEI